MKVSIVSLRHGHVRSSWCFLPAGRFDSGGQTTSVVLCLLPFLHSQAHTASPKWWPFVSAIVPGYIVRLCLFPRVPLMNVVRDLDHNSSELFLMFIHKSVTKEFLFSMLH